MPEALEKWDCNLLKSVCPRIFSIIVEINERYCKELWERYQDEAKVSHMSIIENNKVKMATLCVHACHSVNGVAKIHSEIIKKETFKDEYLDTPTKFKNVTNGIAYRRWLYQSNEGLTELLKEKIGDGFLRRRSELSKFTVFADDKEVLRTAWRDQEGEQGALRQVCQEPLRRDTEHRFHLRLPGKETARVQASAAERPEHHRGVQLPQRTPTLPSCPRPISSRQRQLPATIWQSR